MGEKKSFSLFEKLIKAEIKSHIYIYVCVCVDVFVNYFYIGRETGITGRERQTDR